MPAYQTALAQGVDFVDVDIVFTKDKDLLAYHDLLLNPAILQNDNSKENLKFNLPKSSQLLTKLVASGALELNDILINQLTFSQLQDYNVWLNPKSKYSKWFSKQKHFPYLKLVNLQKIVDYVNKVSGKSVDFQVEIKNDFINPSWSFPPSDLAKMMYDFICKNNLNKRIKIQAFDWRILVELNRLDPLIKTAYLDITQLQRKWKEWFNNSIITDTAIHIDKSNPKPITKIESRLKLIKQLGGYSYEVEDNLLTLKEIKIAQDLGLKVMVWSWPEHSGFVFCSKLYTKLIQWGIDGIITDKPQELNILLKELGYTTPKQFASKDF